MKKKNKNSKMKLIFASLFLLSIWNQIFLWGMELKFVTIDSLIVNFQW